MVRHVPLPLFDVRWLWGIVILVPVLVSAGVVWLHQQPAGPKAPAGMPVVEVRLVQEAASALVVAAAPDIVQSEGRNEPILEAPDRLIPKDTTVIATAPATLSPAPQAQDAATAADRRVRSAPTGLASVFQRKLLNHIAQFKRYPARVHGAPQGVAYVMFAMQRDGSLVDVWMQRSSGHAALDQAAADTIRRAQPLPTIPIDLPERLTVLLPVSFGAP